MDSNLDKMLNVEVYEGVDLHEIIQQIHRNQSELKESLDSTLIAWTSKIKNSQDLVVMGPIIMSLINAISNNNDQLIRLVQAVSKIILSKPLKGESGDLIPDDEKAQLLQNALPHLTGNGKN